MAREIEPNRMLFLTCLRQNAFDDTASAAKLLQPPHDAARGVPDRLAQSGTGTWSAAEKPLAPLSHIPSTSRLPRPHRQGGVHEGERNRPDPISGNGSAVR